MSVVVNDGDEAPIKGLNPGSFRRCEVDGDMVTARVMNINSEERRIGLSIKRLEMEDDQNLLSEYVNNMGQATSTFGEILRENLQEKLNED